MHYISTAVASMASCPSASNGPKIDFTTRAAPMNCERRGIGYRPHRPEAEPGYGPAGTMLLQQFRQQGRRPWGMDQQARVSFLLG